MTVTPVLADQLEAAGRRRADARASCASTGSAPPSAKRAEGPADLRAAAEAEARRYGARSSGSTDARGPRRRRLRPPRPASAGVELMASAATHAVLPLLATRAGQRLQVDAGMRSHRAPLRPDASGFWLPECAYRPGIEACSPSAGVRVLLRRPERARGAARRRSLPAARRAPGRSRSRSTGRPSRWSGRRRLPVRSRLPRLPPPVAERDAAVGDRRRPLRPRRGRRARAPPRRTSSSTRVRGDAWRELARRAAGAASLTFALDTELLGALVERGADVARRGARQAAPDHGIRLVTLPAARGRARAGRRARSPSRRGASARTCRRGTRRRWPTSSGAARRLSCACCATLELERASAGPRRRARRARAAGGRSRATGRSSTSAAGRRLRLQRAWAAPRVQPSREATPSCATAWTEPAPREPRRAPDITPPARPRTRTSRPRPARWSPASSRAGPGSIRVHVRAARPDPLLGVPAADRGRARAPRAQAVREPRRSSTSRCTC